MRHVGDGNARRLLTRFAVAVDAVESGVEEVVAAVVAETRVVVGAVPVVAPVVSLAFGVALEYRVAIAGVVHPCDVVTNLDDRLWNIEIFNFFAIGKAFVANTFNAISKVYILKTVATQECFVAYVGRP